MPFDNLKRSGPQRGAGERAINLPPAILWLIAINVAIHLLRQVLSNSIDQQLVIEFGLVPANITGDQGSLLLGLVSLVTYQFLHGGWVHLGVNMLSLAAFGAPVERLLGVRRFVLFYLSAGIVAGCGPRPVLFRLARPGHRRVGLDQRRVRRGPDADAAGRQPVVVAARRRDMDRPQRVLRHLRRHARCRRRAGRLGGPHRRLRLRPCRHPTVHAAATLPQLSGNPPPDALSLQGNSGSVIVCWGAAVQAFLSFFC